MLCKAQKPYLQAGLQRLVMFGYVFGYGYQYSGSGIKFQTKNQKVEALQMTGFIISKGCSKLAFRAIKKRRCR